MSSRVAAICKSVLIALSDPSLRPLLASINARSVRRSFSKSSSRSKVIATSGFSLNDLLLRGPTVTRMGQRPGPPSRPIHKPQPIPGRHPRHVQYCSPWSNSARFTLVDSGGWIRHQTSRPCGDRLWGSFGDLSWMSRVSTNLSHEWRVTYGNRTRYKLRRVFTRV